MRTLLCHFLQQIRRRPQGLKERHRAAQGQVLVIFGVSLLALIFFVGLAVDAGSLYVTYGQLKRAVDAAAVASANDFKLHAETESVSQRLTSMTAAASEVLKLHNVDLSQVDLTVLICDENGDGVRDESLATDFPDFYNKCPNTPTQSARKLVYVSATQKAPLYFLSLLGFQWARLSTNSIAEAASVDLVLVFDVSGSMSKDTQNGMCASGTCPFEVNAYDPNNDPSNPNDSPNYTGCNVTHSCQPLQQAKDAAKTMLSHLFSGYDHVAIVTFDSTARETFALGQNNNPGVTTHLEEASAAIDAINLHHDAPLRYLWTNWKTTPNTGDWAFNPVNPEDRDGDGLDSDPALPACAVGDNNPSCWCWLTDNRWDDIRANPSDPNSVIHDYYGWGGVPCDSDSALDAYDWNEDGVWEASDATAEQNYLTTTTTTLYDTSGAPHDYYSLSPNSTCTGCGIRLASNILRSDGRSGSVWVIVFLSDGLVNLSDTAGAGGSGPGDTQSTLGLDPTSPYANGFCNGGLNSTNWLNLCVPQHWVSSANPRICIDTSWTTCPPTIHATYQLGDTDKYETSPNTTDYNPLDYAMDMTDTAALTKSLNTSEPRGNDIAIYSIGLGNEVGTSTSGDTTSPGYIGEQLLRYMAAVGDDGDRETDPCDGANSRTSCGQYYYASSGANLMPIYEDIANRIYTRITE